MEKKTQATGPNWVKLGLLFVLALAIGIFSLFPEQVEKYYSVGVYPGIATTLRIITRWIPFSLGDILYSLITIWLIIRIVKGIRRIVRKEYSKAIFVEFLYRFTKGVLWIYIVFKLIWGLNYNRLGIEHQLGIAKPTYTKEEVTQLTHQLIDKMNECRRQIKDTSLPQPPLDSIYRQAFLAYQNASYEHEFMLYGNRSVKASLFSSVADYMNFTGYYNPFTGEAQIRTDIPRMLVPYVICHEMAHQLGYASESEANFVGYLAAAASSDAYTRYSVYNDLFSYAQGEQIFMYVFMSGKDSSSKAFEEEVIKYNKEHLDTLVKKDRREVREFFRKRKNRVAPAISSVYDQYLKMNKQIRGIDSYNEVIGWLLAYQKKYGKI
jgi:hypothetical protein